MSEAARDLVLEYLDKKYNLLIYKIAYGILKDENLVDDVKQTVLMKCMNKTEMLSLMDDKARTGYIATAAKNAAVDELRKMTKKQDLEDHYIEVIGKSLTMDVVDFDAFEDKYGFSDEVWHLLNYLPAIDRDLLVLKFYYCYSNGEIAEYFGTNVEHVKKRYQRAKTKLAKLIEKRGLKR